MWEGKNWSVWQWNDICCTFITVLTTLMYFSTDTLDWLLNGSDSGEVPVRDGGGSQGRLHHRLKGESLIFWFSHLLIVQPRFFNVECEYFTGQFDKRTVAMIWMRSCSTWYVYLLTTSGNTKVLPQEVKMHKRRPSLDHHSKRMHSKQWWWWGGGMFLICNWPCEKYKCLWTFFVTM